MKGISRAVLILGLILPFSPGVRPLLAQTRAPSDTAAIRIALQQWFHCIETGATDSLPLLLDPRFVFVAEGSRQSAQQFVTMIRGAHITDAHVKLSNVVTYSQGMLGYAIYDYDETASMGGRQRRIRETGTIVFRRAGTRWLMLSWTATSPGA